MFFIKWLSTNRIILCKQERVGRAVEHDEGCGKGYKGWFGSNFLKVYYKIYWEFPEDPYLDSDLIKDRG